MDEIPINPQTGRPVTRFVKAKHRDLTREVILKRTGATVTIKAHDFDPTLHACLPPATAPEAEAVPEAAAEKNAAEGKAPAPLATKKKTTKKKTTKKRAKKT
jgi:hypothetical protein